MAEIEISEFYAKILGACADCFKTMSRGSGVSIDREFQVLSRKQEHSVEHGLRRVSYDRQGQYEGQNSSCCRESVA